MKIKFLGAAKTVTGSRTLMSFNHHKFLIDCGLFQGPKPLRTRNWQKPEGLEGLSGVLLTHAHIDHSGYLPKLVKDGFRGPIYCTEATAELCKIMLLDAAHLQEEDARFANMAKYSRHSPCLPLFDTQDAMAAIEFLRPMPMNKWHELHPGIGFQFLRSGHILGSAFIQIQYTSGNESRLLTFSGDLGNQRSKVLKPPVHLMETDYLVLEATYGDRVQSHEDPLMPFAEIINRVISRRGTLVIPAFTVGRTQEMLHMIHELQRKNLIGNVPVYLDSPMAQDVTEIYLRFKDELRLENHEDGFVAPFSPLDYKVVKSADDSMLLCMSTKPKIVISAAGMLTGGRVMHHLKAKLPDENSAVLFVGYQPEGTKGRLLRSGLTTIRIHHELVHVEAEILSLDNLSAHADSDETLDWLKQLQRKPREVFLNHGEPAALEALKYRIQTELGWKARVVEQDEEILLDGLEVKV
ncbi:MAG: MBL fold metallo-hydrolase RNA specificity domain-containing protein [Bdellovibrionales bacterium]